MNDPLALVYTSLFGILKNCKVVILFKTVRIFFNTALNIRFLINGLKLFYEVHIQSRNPLSIWPLK